MPLALDLETVALDEIPQLLSITDTPPPVSKLDKSSVGSQGSTGVDAISMPQLGDEFCGFHLMAVLGTGTFATVFLAEQEALAGRKVAVKVTMKATREPERLARLQHTNVVPVYSVHEAAPAQVICMPYLGRRTLSHELGGRKSQAVIAGLSTRKANATKKGSSVAGSRTRINPALPAVPEPKSGSRHSEVPNENPLVGNVSAILPILLQLADGLAHAHERGVLHLDLKPANVLLADTGEPMLLDFNLSYAEAEGKRELVGGTIPYMAPEQLLDLKKRGTGTVDARTDLYSLGVMAFELLTGKHPFPVTSRSLTEFDGLIATRNQGAPSVRAVNPAVSAAVESIVMKLLAPTPADRYQTARELREDLDRQLTDRPLKFAPDRSIAERLGKWRRRNPRTMIAMIVAAALAACGGAGAYALDEVEKRGVREAENRVRTTRDGLADSRLDLILPDAATRTRGMKKAMNLLAAYDLPRNPNWKASAEFKRVPADQKAALAADLGELLLLVAGTRMEEGKAADRDGAWNDARILNQLAADCFGDAPPPMVARQLAELNGKSTEAGNPKSPRDHFLEGAWHYSKSKFDAAVRPLQKAVAGQPDHGAANFLLARCRQHVGQFEAAVERYEVASSLLPHDVRPIYFKGVAMGLSGRHAAAEEAFTAAIEIDGSFADGYQGRAVAAMEQREYRDADRDFTTAMEKGAAKLQSLYLRAYVRDLLKDQDGAATDRQAAAKLTPERDSDFVARGYTKMKTAPREALADFLAAIKLNPASLTARRNQICILADELRDDLAALEAVDELVAMFPEYGYGRATRAICLARLGRRDAAIAEAEACMKLLNAKGPNYRDPNLVYRIALVYAISSANHASDQVVSIRYLKDVIRTGFNNFEALDKDRDLDTIRESKSFKDAVKAARELAN